MPALRVPRHVPRWMRGKTGFATCTAAARSLLSDHSRPTPELGDPGRSQSRPAQAKQFLHDRRNRQGNCCLSKPDQWWKLPEASSKQWANMRSFDSVNPVASNSARSAQDDKLKRNGDVQVHLDKGKKPSPRLNNRCAKHLLRTLRKCLPGCARPVPRRLREFFEQPDTQGFRKPRWLSRHYQIRSR